MPSFFKHADALIISLLDREVFNITIPGKIQFYLTSGIPIVGMISGEGAKVINIDLKSLELTINYENENFVFEL